MRRSRSARHLVTPSGEVLQVGAIADGEALVRNGDLVEGGTGGSGGAPAAASYVVLGTNATLSAERVLAVGSGLDLVDGGAGSTVTVQLDLSEVSAAGDLSGTMDAPTVAKLDGVIPTAWG